MKHLESIDIFSSNVQIYQTSRDKKTNAKTFSPDHSSIFGWMLTIVCLIVTSIYLWNEITQMFAGNHDNISQTRKKNTFNVDE